MFDLVKKRKINIDARQKTVDKREKKAEDHVERMKDPIYREEYKKLKKDREFTTNPIIRQKVLARGEKSRKYLPVSECLDRKSFNDYRKRLYILENTNPRYHCSNCGECKTKLSDWFVSKKVDVMKIPLDLMMNAENKPKRKIMCRSCVSAFGWNPKKTDPIYLDEDVKIFETVLYFKIDATDLCRKRINNGKTVRQFADLVGWTPDYQYKLENGSVLKIGQEAMGDLVMAFDRLDVFIKMDIWGRAADRYIPNGPAIKALRINKGLSAVAFSKKVGWSRVYQHKVETGKTKTVNKEAMLIIVSILR